MGLLSDVYVANALVGMYQKSDIWTGSRRNSQETLAGNGQQQDTKDTFYSEQRHASNTLQGIGLFTLDEEKDNGTCADARKIYIGVASQLCGTPLPIDVVGHELRIKINIGNGRNVKCNESELFLNYENVRYQANRLGSVKLFNLLQEGSTRSDQLVLVVFIDSRNLNKKDAGFVNMELVRISGDVPALGLPP
uniref:Uncharacterized protein n=1 Tax=Arundo donax TaxID=35708 RepID=A0A0A9DI09_ARUDO